MNYADKARRDFDYIQRVKEQTEDMCLEAVKQHSEIFCYVREQTE